MRCPHSGAYRSSQHTGKCTELRFLTRRANVRNGRTRPWRCPRPAQSRFRHSRPPADRQPKAPSRPGFRRPPRWALGLRREAVQATWRILGATGPSDSIHRAGRERPKKWPQRADFVWSADRHRPEVAFGESPGAGGTEGARPARRGVGRPAVPGPRPQGARPRHGPRHKWVGSGRVQGSGSAMGRRFVS